MDIVKMRGIKKENNKENSTFKTTKEEEAMREKKINS